MGQGAGLWAGHLPGGSEPLVPTQVPLPLDHPGGEVMLLVNQARDDHGLGYDEQDGEGADPENQLLQLVCLGPILLHHCPDLDETEETEDKENAAEAEVGGERS